MRTDGRLFWIRATWLLDRLGRGQPTTAADLGAHFEVSLPTARRLMDALRDDFGAPLEFDRATNTWSLADPHWTLPRLPLTPGEVTALAFARGVITHVTAPGIADHMTRFWNKLSLELTAQSPEGAAFADSVTALAPRWTTPDRAVMDTILRGLALGRRLELDYQSPWSATRTPARPVELRHLVLYEGSFYLAAHCLLRHGALRLFHLCAIARATLTDHPVSDRPFRLEDVIDSYGVMLGEDPVDVTVRISPPAALRAAFEVWHPAQRDHLSPDDHHLTRTFPTRGFAEVQRLVLSFGAAAEVLAPPALVARIHDEIRAMAAALPPPAGGAPAPAEGGTTE